jgi:hypothetical protein
MQVSLLPTADIRRLAPEQPHVRPSDDYGGVNAAEAREHLARELEQRAAHHDCWKVRDAFDELAAWLKGEAVDEHPDLIVGDVSPERCEAILHGLEEQGVPTESGQWPSRWPSSD